MCMDLRMRARVRFIAWVPANAIQANFEKTTCEVLSLYDYIIGCFVRIITC